MVFPTIFPGLGARLSCRHGARLQQLLRKESIKPQYEFRQRCAGENAARPLDGVFGEPAILRLPINLNLLFWGEHEPALLHAGG